MELVVVKGGRMQLTEEEDVKNRYVALDSNPADPSSVIREAVALLTTMPEAERKELNGFIFPTAQADKLMLFDGIGYLLGIGREFEEDREFARAAIQAVLTGCDVEFVRCPGDGRLKALRLIPTA